MEQNHQLIGNQPVYNIRDLYDKYAGMLLGYIYHTVKDHALAEKYLVDIFKELPGHLQEINKRGANTWLHLQKLAKAKVAAFVENLKENERQGLIAINSYIARNKFLGMMSAEQQQVFCGVYYHHQTTAILSQQLKMSEDAVRRILKEAFTVMRQAV